MVFRQINILVLLNLISTVSLGQIIWDSHKRIDWCNFKGSPPNASSDFKANTFSSVECEFGNSDTCFYYYVKACFYEEKSWKIDTTACLLEHERGHFDISELYARKIRKFLSLNLGKEISEVEIIAGVELIQDEKNRYQDLYDKETMYSQNSVKQREWLRNIQQKLEELKTYRNPKFNNCSELSRDEELP